MADEEWDVEVEEAGEEVKKLSLGDDEDTAVAEAQAAAEANPQDAAAQAALGQALLDSGDDEGAVAAFQAAVAIDNSADNQYRLGVALKAGDQTDKAREAFAAAVAADGAHSGALCALGAYALDSNADEGLALFRKAADADAGNSEACRQAGQILLGRGVEEAKEAAALFAKVAERDPSDGNARAALVQAYDKVGADADRDAAREALLADAAAGKLNEAFVAFNRFLVGQFEVGDKLVLAFEHLTGDNKFTFNVYKKGEVHDSKILETVTVAEPGFGDAKAKVTAQLQ